MNLSPLTITLFTLFWIAFTIGVYYITGKGDD